MRNETLKNERETLKVVRNTEEDFYDLEDEEFELFENYTDNLVLEVFC